MLLGRSLITQSTVEAVDLRTQFLSAYFDPPRFQISSNFIQL